MDTEDSNGIVKGKILQWTGTRGQLKGRRPAAIALPAMATGALAIGALAVGALAIGALAIGSLAIGRFAIGKGKIKSLEIDELTVRRLRVLEKRQILAARLSNTENDDWGGIDGKTHIPSGRGRRNGGGCDSTEPG